MLIQVVYETYTLFHKYWSSNFKMMLYCLNFFLFSWSNFVFYFFFDAIITVSINLNFFWVCIQVVFEIYTKFHKYCDSNLEWWPDSHISNFCWCDIIKTIWIDKEYFWFVFSSFMRHIRIFKSIGNSNFEMMDWLTYFEFVYKT